VGRVFQFVTGIVVIAASLLTATFILIVLTRSIRLRWAHGRLNQEFFRVGSGFVFGLIGLALISGIAMVYFSHR
jgi:hypothetical protein